MSKRKNSQNILGVSKVVLATLIAVVGFSSIFVLDKTGLLSELEWKTVDFRMQFHRADKALPQGIEVILIDESSLALMDPILGRWPWPRAIYADILQFIFRGNPRAVLFDIKFFEHQKNNVDPSNSLSIDDEQLLLATKDYADIVHAVQIYHDKENKDLERKGHFSFLSKNGHGEALNNITFPFAELKRATRSLGDVNILKDNDGVVRRIQLVKNYDNEIYPAISMAPFISDLNLLNFESLNGNSVETTVGLIPFYDSNGNFLVNYYGKYRPYSMGGVLKSEQLIKSGELQNLVIDPVEFRDKIVFIGASASSAKDLINAPFQVDVPGVMLHAAAAGNYLTGDFLRPVNQNIIYIFSLLLSLLVTSSIILSKNPVSKFALPFFVLLVIIVGAFWLFSNNRVMTLLVPFLSVFGSSVIALIFLALTEGRERKRVRLMFSQYVSDAVLKSVIDQTDGAIEAEVGCKEEISILFSDIRGFTTLSESMQPEKVVELLNLYFSKMSDAIFSHQGTIDKFIGDAIMAFWGAPIKSELHAEQALQAAIEMFKALESVNDDLLQNGHIPLQMGVGVNTGLAIVGNIGSSKKLDYTAIGDSVNLASRLEGLSKTYGKKIIISESTYHQIKKNTQCQIVDQVQVKGKIKPIKIYSPILNVEGFEVSKAAELSFSGFCAFQNRDWDTAIAYYSQLESDPLTKIFVNRCLTFKNNEPIETWEGTHILTSK